MRFYVNLTPLLSTIFQAAEFAAELSNSIFVIMPTSFKHLHMQIDYYG